MRVVNQAEPYQSGCLAFEVSEDEEDDGEEGQKPARKQGLNNANDKPSLTVGLHTNNQPKIICDNSCEFVAKGSYIEYTCFDLDCHSCSVKLGQ